MARIDDITIPGGIKVFFTETGGSELDLGNIVGDSVSINRDTDLLDHYSNRSGLRKKNKIFPIEENVQIDFELDEVNVNHMRYFFKGASLTTITPGTTAVVDQLLTINGTQFVTVGRPGLTAVTVSQFLDSVEMFDGASTYTDHLAEARTPAGTPFTINGDADDELFLGKDSVFGSVDYDTTVQSVGYTNTDWQYWNGSTWATLSATGNTDFDAASGNVTWAVPSDWVQNAVNGVTRYWVKFVQDAAGPTAATVDNIGHDDATLATDYMLDPGDATNVTTQKDGAIARLAAGVLVDGEIVEVDYTYATFASTEFGIAEQSIIEGSARFECFPQSGRGSSWSIRFPRAQLQNNGSMDLDDSDFQTMPLSLVVLDNSDVSAVDPLGTVNVQPSV